MPIGSSLLALASSATLTLPRVTLPAQRSRVNQRADPSQYEYIRSGEMTAVALDPSRSPGTNIWSERQRDLARRSAARAAAGTTLSNTKSLDGASRANHSRSPARTLTHRRARRSSAAATPLSIRSDTSCPPGRTHSVALLAHPAPRPAGLGVVLGLLPALVEPEHRPCPAAWRSNCSIATRGAWPPPHRLGRTASLAKRPSPPARRPASDRTGGRSPERRRTSATGRSSSETMT